MNFKESRRKMVILAVIPCLLLALSGTTGISSAAETVIYVDAGATGSNNGTSWHDAFTNLQSALTAAGPGDEIWVAEGIYKPTDGPDREASFQLKNRVAVYGGFEGTETSRDQRDWSLHETILSGDIGTPDVNSDNSYHVVTGSGMDATAVLDGFTITGGNAQGSYPNNRGGGMYNDHSSPTLTNVTFSGNSADEDGGGMHNLYSSPTLTNVSFSGNSATDEGGGMYNWYESSPTLTNVTFSGNSASWDGGGMYNAWDSSPTLADVTFTDNSALYKGGGILNGESSPMLVNVTFSGNYAHDGGGMYNSYSSSPTLTNVTFRGNSAEYGGGMLNTLNCNPLLTNVTFADNSATVGGGMYNDNYSSPTLTNSILWGNTAPNGSQIYNVSVSSDPTIGYSLVQGSGGSDGSWDTGLGTDGGGNIDADPEFVDAANGDLHLQATSPAIDKGANTAVPPDTLDLDGDGNTAEPLPFDLDGNPRTVNCTVDMGAYEHQRLDFEGPIASNVTVDPLPAPLYSAIWITANVDDTTTGCSDIKSAEYSVDGSSWISMDAADGNFDALSEDVEEPGGLAFPEAGVHDVCVRGTDAHDNIGAEDCILLAVYDPTAGFVTGGGWIWSQPGAYMADASLEGKATFGFVSRYKKGATVPTGQTEFQFHTADLNFHSDSYEWLVVTGSNYARFKGSGTINGMGEYKFMLWAGDGEADTFRIRIWEEDEESGTETVTYDNGFEQAIAGGSIVIHSK